MEPKTDKLIEWLTNAAQKGGAFVEAEAPQYAAEVVNWCFWSGVLAIALGVALIGIGLFFANWLYQSGQRDQHNYYDKRLPPELSLIFVLLAFAGLAGGLACSAVGTSLAVKATVSPRVVIVESLRP